jgi:hypothetical protein
MIFFGLHEFLVEPNVDWITLTTRSESRGAFWLDFFHQLSIAKSDEKSLFCKRKWRALGYSGYSIEGMRYGYSETLGYIIIATGDIGNVTWRSLIGPSTRVTRIDLACTVSLGMEYNNLSSAYYRYVEGLREESKLGGRKYSLIRNLDGGQTLYVGSRKSGEFGRVYDKGAEAREVPGFRWRYEVEYKKPRSGLVAEALAAVKEKNGGHIVATVHDWFADRMVPPLFSGSEERLRLETHVRLTSHEKKLAWLRKYVRPSVQELIASGRRDETLSALGLDGYELKEPRT